MKRTLLLTIAIFSVSCLLAASSSDHLFRKESYANNGGVFERFNAHRQQNGIALSWIFNTTAETVRFTIEKSYDGYSFEAIDQVAPNSKGMNRYFDANVYPGYIYYRLKAIDENGNIFYSSVDMVRIVRNG